jgi:hypothetical protein
MAATIKAILGALLLFLILLAHPATADLYQWTDENGVRHFSNVPPPDGVEKSILAEEIPYDPETDDIRRTREDAMLQERESAETERRLEEAERKAEEARREAEAAKRKADRLEKELEEEKEDRSYGVYYYRKHRPGHRPPGHKPPGYRPPGHKPPGYRPPGQRPPGWRPKPEPYNPQKPWKQPPRQEPRGEKRPPRQG